MARRITIELSDADAERLHSEAQRLGVSDEDLARAAVSSQLSEAADEFRRAMERVLSKNTELYKRLA